MITVGVMEMFHLFFVRNIRGTSLTWKGMRGTRVIWVTFVGVSFLQFAITYVAPLQEVFSSQAGSRVDGLLVVVVGVALFAIVETENQMRLLFRRSDCMTV